MKITIESSDRTVIVEDSDVLRIDDVMDLICDALCAVGFHPDNVARYRSDYIEED